MQFLPELSKKHMEVIMKNSNNVREQKNNRVFVSVYDAFSDVPEMGNPAGVIFDAEDLTEEQLQMIAKKVGFNETTYLFPSNSVDFRLRYFTPGHEMDLCGHGTIAAIYGWMERNNVRDSRHLTIETRAGILQVYYDKEKREVMMEQAPAEFVEYDGEIAQLTEAIGLSEEVVDQRFPVVYGSTGIWTLILPIKKLKDFVRMKPDNQRFQEILTQIPTASVHPICLETYDSACTLHGRHFSSPRSGTVEDSVTGTASGVMGAYYATYIHSLNRTELMVEQGNEIGRKGVVRVFVEKKHDQTHVSISGKAVFVRDINVDF